jgi:hypothetical protein
VPAVSGTTSISVIWSRHERLGSAGTAGPVDGSRSTNSSSRPSVIPPAVRAAPGGAAGGRDLWSGTAGPGYRRPSRRPGCRWPHRASHTGIAEGSRRACPQGFRRPWRSGRPDPRELARRGHRGSLLVAAQLQPPGAAAGLAPDLGDEQVISRTAASSGPSSHSSARRTKRKAIPAPSPSRKKSVY